MTAGIVFYTDHRVPVKLAHRIQNQIRQSQLPIVTASLKPMGFGRNVIVGGKRGVLTMFRQILAGLEAAEEDYIFFCEHDVFYHLSHFDFRPPRDDLVFYNVNVWKVRMTDGFAVRVDDCRQTSGLCARRELLLEHYRERVRRVELEGFTRRMGFEPGTHGRAERVDDLTSGIWSSEFPNLDLRLPNAMTASRWSPEEYRNKRFALGWTESRVEDIPGWEGLNLTLMPEPPEPPKPVAVKNGRSLTARYDLSILIPARNEMFLRRTIEDILEHSGPRTEVIAALDGEWADPQLEQHERVSIVYLPEALGQRGATNQAARASEARWVMKCDAHCSFAPGFDEELMAAMEGNDDWTIVPKMYNLHAFDWVCANRCGWKQYQGPTPTACGNCGAAVERDMLWHAKKSPETTSMRFDRDLKFQYWGGYKAQQEGDLVESMSLLGACWMLTRERYWELDICDEGHGGWGQQGTEVACKTWLSGGRLIVDKRTWFAHMFRTQGGDFSFPYPLSGGAVDRARDYSRHLWLEDGWEKAVRPLSWIIDHFAPVPDWNE